jgi:hypothetical protein
VEKARCPFYHLTAQGMRCVLASPEEWKALLSNGRRPPCVGGRDPCPFRSRLEPKGGNKVRAPVQH